MGARSLTRTEFLRIEQLILKFRQENQDNAQGDSGSDANERAWRYAKLLDGLLANMGYAKR